MSAKHKKIFLRILKEEQPQNWRNILRAMEGSKYNYSGKTSTVMEIVLKAMKEVANPALKKRKKRTNYKALREEFFLTIVKNTTDRQETWQAIAFITQARELMFYYDKCNSNLWCNPSLFWEPMSQLGFPKDDGKYITLAKYVSDKVKEHYHIEATPLNGFNTAAINCSNILKAERLSKNNSL